MFRTPYWNLALHNYKDYDTIEKLRDLLKPIVVTDEMFSQWHGVTGQDKFAREKWVHRLQPSYTGCCGQNITERK